MPTETRESNKGHKYLTIAEYLRRQITDGGLKAGDRLPKFSEMRSQFGATPTTVERVYSLLESEQLVVREQGRGIFVARPQVPVSKGAIALCSPLPSMDHAGAAYWSQLTAGIREALPDDNQNLILCNDVHSGLVDQCDGMLLLIYTPIETILEHVPQSFPMVSVVIPRTGIVSVISDETGGFCQAVEHLLSLGHRRIAHLSDGTIGSQSMWRRDSYRAALRNAGIEPKAEWVLEGDPKEVVLNYLEWGRDRMKRWLQDGFAELGCTALTAQNDEIAVGAMQVLQDAGIQIPEQLSVTGFDSTIWCDFVQPTLTSVELPLRKIGVLASEILQQQIRGERPAGICLEDKAETICLPTRLTIRQSAATVSMRS
jgi:DNA-binding LacI/PurR family transcriptional regulator